MWQNQMEAGSRKASKASTNDEFNTKSIKPNKKRKKEKQTDIDLPNWRERFGLILYVYGMAFREPKLKGYISYTTLTQYTYQSNASSFDWIHQYKIKLSKSYFMHGISEWSNFSIPNVNICHTHTYLDPMDLVKTDRQSVVRWINRSILLGLELLHIKT